MKILRYFSKNLVPHNLFQIGPQINNIYCGIPSVWGAVRSESSPLRNLEIADHERRGIGGRGEEAFLGIAMPRSVAKMCRFKFSTRRPLRPGGRDLRSQLREYVLRHLFASKLLVPRRSRSGPDGCGDLREIGPLVIWRITKE